MELKIHLQEDLYQQFRAALLVSGKTQEQVFTEAAEALVRQVFFGEPAPTAPVETPNAQAVQAALRRWAEDTAAVEHLLLQAYFRCSFGSDVYKPTLRAVFCGETGLTVADFEAVLKTMSAGELQIFRCTKDTVALSPEAAEAAYSLRTKFLNQ